MSGNQVPKGQALIQGDKTSGLEHELILAAVSLDRSKDEQICRILEGALDWPFVLQIAIQQGVLPLFCQRLIDVAEMQIPAQEITKLNVLLQANFQNNLRLTWKLVECVELLSGNGVECIVLKGPALALQAYGDLSKRQFTDLDILIHPIDFPKVYGLLELSGYIPTFKLDNKQIKFQVWSDNYFSFNRQGDMFDVHWYIAPEGIIHPLVSEQMWQQLISVQIYNSDIRTLAPEYMVLFTCLHGAKHGWNQLKWIVDLAYLSRSLSENAWFDLFEHAKQMGLFRQVCLGLLLAEDLVDVMLPVRIHDLIKTDHHAQALASQVKGGFLNSSNHPSVFRNLLFFLKSRERWQDRRSYLLHLIFMPRPRDWLTISLPENLFFLYHFFRPIRLLYKLGKTAISVEP